MFKGREAWWRELGSFDTNRSGSDSRLLFPEGGLSVTELLWAPVFSEGCGKASISSFPHPLFGAGAQAGLALHELLHELLWLTSIESLAVVGLYAN